MAPGGLSPVLALAFRPRGGRPGVSEEIRALIHRMVSENADWGAPKIHGELLKLGFEVSERTVARYLRRLQRRGDPNSGSQRMRIVRPCPNFKRPQADFRTTTR